MSTILSSRLIVPAWVFLICVAALSSAVALPNLSVSRVGLTGGGGGSDDFNYYGALNGVRAFSFASTGCNLGAAPAEYIAGPSGNHPVVATNMYRLLNGRFEQIGMSWLRHTSCAVSEPTCGNCQPTPCSSLGIMNSDRAGGSFFVPIPSGVIVLSSGFHDIDYHSGDGLGGVNYDGTDWAVTQPAGSLTWSTDSFAANPNANALRWDTLYNFRFVANAPPEAFPGAVTLGLFKPGTPAAIAPRAFVPSANAVPIDCAIILAGDVNLDAALDGRDVERFSAILVNGNGNAAEICAADLDGSNDGGVDLNDLPVFINCLLSGGCP